MKKEECDRKNLLKEELISDWDELNIAFKSLIIVCIILFIVIIAIAFFSDGETGLKHSLEVIFRSTLSSVFGFLLSSSIKANTGMKNNEIERLRQELKKVEFDVEEIYESQTEQDIECKLKEVYSYKDINLVQILIALTKAKRTVARARAPVLFLSTPSTFNFYLPRRFLSGSI
jgi:hypothetical protein